MVNFQIMPLKPYFLIVLFCLLQTVPAQAQFWKSLAEEGAVIVAPFYEEDFESVTGEPERWVAERLMRYDMQGLIDANIIHRDDMKGLALPLGIHNREDYFLDFGQGMLDMWRQKAIFADGKNYRLKANVMVKALDFVEAVRFKATRSNIRDYRNDLLADAISKVKAIHEQRKSAYSTDRMKFMDIFMDNFSPNVMLGYNVQELVPPTHMIGGKIYSINPLFKIYYLDLILKEGGMEVFEGFPARYDALLSHGPFQMTDLALAGINENKRLFDELKQFDSVEKLNGVSDHALVAAIFAYYNWEMLSYSLQASGGIEAFNKQYDGSLGSDEQRRLRILIAGLTACMHHQPAKARRMLREALQDGDFNRIHYKILDTPAAGKQMDKYYRSAAEAYLLMKVYHVLLDEYGEK